MQFSILIPVYNVEKYLSMCIDSVLAQNYSDYEIILLDDGATDQSGSICDTYAKRYPEKIRVIHKANEGLLMTRRRGLREAKGNYFVFVDSDDLVEPNLLETLDRSFRKYRADMVIYRFYRFLDGSDERTIFADFPYSDGKVFEGEGKNALYERFILHHTFSNLWLKAVNRDCVDIDADYSQYNVRRCEDVVQSFPLFDKAKRIVCVDVPLYHYRKFAASMTGTTRSADCSDYLATSKRTFEYIERWKLSKEIYHQYTAWQLTFYFNYLRNLYRETPKEARKDVMRQTLEKMDHSPTFAKICMDENRAYVHKRMRGRIYLFRKSLKQKKWNDIVRLICLTNLIGSWNG